MGAEQVHVDQQSSPRHKIALFRSLFRGREDVYPRRFESRKTGKSGYSPACANEWVRGICEKPRVKCAECDHRRFLPVTDDIIRWHLSGHDDAGQPFVAGVYPMLQDESCLFLAIDFDKQDWQQDVSAFLDTCRELKLPAALERSRSGRGGHVWFFFAEAIPAALARKLGSFLLTETMERRPDIGLDSYDRLFPNQDTLPQGGFGNLIAMPLQKQARERGNSVFVDDRFEPHADQWAFLGAVGKLGRSQVESAVAHAERHGRVIGVRLPALDEDEPEPWAVSPSRRPKESPIVGDLPLTLEVVLGNEIYVPTDGLVPGLRNRLIRIAAFQNPEFYKAQAMRLPTYDKPRVIACAEQHPHHLGLPRGCLTDLRHLLDDLHISLSVRDERCAGQPLDVAFHGDLRPEQQAAANALLAHDTGVLAATTAFGKTVVAARLIAERQVNTLVLVHRQQLLDQWVDRLSTFLGLPPSGIGRVGGGKRKPNRQLDVALTQSLVRKGVVNDCVGDYGHVVVDECHHVSVQSFEQVARRARAKYVLGLSATVTRKDRHHPIIFMQCGPARYRDSARLQAAARPFSHSVIIRPTAFKSRREPETDKRVEFQLLYKELIEDDRRNALICDDLLQAVRDGRSPLVLTERHEHLDRLASDLSNKVQHVLVFRGQTGRRERADLATRLASIPEGEARVLLATGKYIGEGFDDPRLDTLFITLPISWRGTVAQYVGRLHRLHDGKRDVRVYDYADLQVAMLARMFDRRCRAYEAVGYTIVLPASAIPGWPSDVPSPVDPLWKRDYGASVRRLVRDGVDVPLAGLFVDSARPMPAEAEGIERARSATEAFLYRRLETLRETKGRFRLNAELPIPFDGRSEMEVDVLSRELRVAIELDGPQHLTDTAAYRRDRRKDRLLQEHGYLVLRFLSEDVAKDLDGVLDALLRAAAYRQRKA
jgi:superfamily II DNA or RNA helicase/very-short-patch-repair endonuclease